MVGCYQNPVASSTGTEVRIRFAPAASQPLLSPRVKGKSGENCDYRPHRSVGWAALAETPPDRTSTRIRGTVDKLNGQNLMVKSRDGQTLTIELAANVAVITLVMSEPCQKAKGRREMLEVASIQAQARASRIACQMHSLVAGMSRLFTPSGASATPSSVLCRPHPRPWRPVDCAWSAPGSK